MTKVKSARNKTIDTSLDDGYQYLERCITVNNPVNDIFSILDKTVLGDSLEVLKYLPRECVDLIVVDPPYNLTKKFNKNTFSRKSKLDYESYSRKWLAMVAPILKSNGSIYVCCDWETSIIIGNVLGDYFKIQNRITWQREKGRGAKANWKNGMEDIWFATKGDQYTFNLDAVKTRKKVIAPYRIKGKPKDWQETETGNYRDTCPSNFWDDITIPFWSMPENTAHPTQKSEKLIAKIILASSNENDIILDPFLGSGTTSVVAKKLKRRYLGIEMDKQYCLWAEQRLEMADTNAEIQGYVDGVFWERNSLAEQIAVKNSTEQKVEREASLPSEQTIFDFLEMK
ncbi:MAG TPA: site-specific DNA-methyltransferase [Bacteroidales bacterium]|nr:site-specific DNA-methyltransferase [Bacteroidales bacterium]